MLVMNPEGLFLLIYRETRELLPDSPLRDNVLTVVLNVDSPAVRVMLRKVAGPVAVRLRRLTRYREVTDKRPAGFRLLLVFRKPDDFADSSKLPGRPSSRAMTAVQLHCSGGVTRPINALRQVRSKDALNAVFKISGSYRAFWSSSGRLSPLARSITSTGLSSQAYPKRRISKSGL